MCKTILIIIYEIIKGIFKIIGVLLLSLIYLLITLCKLNN